MNPARRSVGRGLAFEHDFISNLVISTLIFKVTGELELLKVVFFFCVLNQQHLHFFGFRLHCQFFVLFYIDCSLSLVFTCMSEIWLEGGGGGLRRVKLQ